MQNAPRIHWHPNCHIELKPKAQRSAFCCTQDLGQILIYLGFPSASTVFALCGASWETAKHNQSSRTDSGCRRDLRRDDLENKAYRRNTIFKYTGHRETWKIACGQEDQHNIKRNMEKSRMFSVSRNWGEPQENKLMGCGLHSPSPLFYMLSSLSRLNCRHRNKTILFKALFINVLSKLAP